jgi:hypothetical protein
MRVVTSVMTGCLFLGMTGLAMANPALLPNHPGYPSRGEFAYDTGRQNSTHSQSLQDAAESENANIVQKLEDPNNPTLLRKAGAGSLPIDQRPGTKRVPSAATATGAAKK